MMTGAPTAPIITIITTTTDTIIPGAAMTGTADIRTGTATGNFSGGFYGYL